MGIYKITEKEQIETIVLEFKSDLYDKTSIDSRLNELAQKYADLATFIVLQGNKSNIGYVAFYCNDNISYQAFISMIVIKKEEQNKGKGKELLNEVIKITKKAGMWSSGLEVVKDNDIAVRFYERNGFYKVNEKEKKYFMKKWI